jgi:hypothetical protein
MGMKASEVGDWLRRAAGKRDHREIVADDYVVIRPGPNFHWLVGAGSAEPPPLTPRHSATSEGRRATGAEDEAA